MLEGGSSGRLLKVVLKHPCVEQKLLLACSDFILYQKIIETSFWVLLLGCLFFPFEYFPVCLV